MFVVFVILDQGIWVSSRLPTFADGLGHLQGFVELSMRTIELESSVVSTERFYGSRERSG